VHFFPEGELKPYDTSLRDFKQGAFHLAAPGLGARGAAVDPSRPADRSAVNAAATNDGPRHRRAIVPTMRDPRSDRRIRMELAWHRRHDLIARAAS